jgi:hypothetical protein
MAAAPMTSRKARHWTTTPSASPGIGSPKTRIPPEIAVTLAAALVIVMTGTASPFWRPRADAKNASTEASTQVTIHGEARPPTRPVAATPSVSALIATSETPKRIPAARPSSAPACSWWPLKRGAKTSRAPTASSDASKAIIAATE